MPVPLPSRRKLVGFQRWSRVGGAADTSPERAQIAALCRKPGSLDIIAVDREGAARASAFHTEGPKLGFTPWVTLGPPSSPPCLAPAAVIRAPGVLDVCLIRS